MAASHRSTLYDSPFTLVDRRPVALDAARGGGTERLQASVWRYRPMCPMK